MAYTTHLLRHLRATIGRNIHHHRSRRKWTLAKLARLSGVPDWLLDHYELGKGDVRLDHMLRIACALGVEVGVLVG